VTDEAYLCPVFEDEVVPLLRSDHAVESGGFWSADAVAWVASAEAREWATATSRSSG
jgi:hypothetical protein